MTMKKYKVETPVTLRGGLIRLEVPEQKKDEPKVKSIADRCKASLKAVKGKKDTYEIVGPLNLKVGTVFEHDGNVKAMLGKYLVDLSPKEEEPEPEGGEDEAEAKAKAEAEAKAKAEAGKK